MSNISKHRESSEGYDSSEGEHIEEFTSQSEETTESEDDKPLQSVLINPLEHLTLTPPTYSPPSTPIPPSIMTTTTKTPELKLHPPAEFNGDRNKTKEFILDCKLYLQVNGGTYSDDEKKMLFVMSNMRGGTAGPWKEDYYNTTMSSNNGNFRTFDFFIDTVDTAFTPSDEKGDARSKLRTLQIKGGMTADEYIAEFRTATAQSGIKDNAALIEYFMEGIPSVLMEKIATMEKPLTKIKGWQD